MMNQTVNFPTRTKAVLDLLLTNRPSLLESTNPTPGFGDHQSAILSDIYCHPKRQKPVQRKVFNWARANIDQLKSDIETGTKSLLD